jgi:hypothetical protein
MPNLKQTAPLFTAHAPNSKQLEDQQIIAGLATQFAHVLVEKCPAGPWLDQALLNVRLALESGYIGIADMGAAQGAGR